MKATELIKELAQAISDFGDLEVVIERDGPTVESVRRKDSNIVLQLPDEYVKRGDARHQMLIDAAEVLDEAGTLATDDPDWIQKAEALKERIRAL